MEIRDELWQKLCEFLNHVADEREQDSTGPGSYPSYNASSARVLIDELGIERKKGKGVF